MADSSSMSNSSQQPTTDIINAISQGSFLTWIPNLFFLLTLPFLIAHCRHNSKKFAKLPFSNQFRVKLILTGFLALNSLFIWFNIIFSTNSFSSIYYIYPGLWVLFFSITFSIHLVRLRCGLVTSGVQHINAFLYLICEVSQFYQRFIESNQDLFVLKTAHITWYTVLFLYNVSLCYADPRAGRTDKRRSPELESSFLNHLTLWWFNSIPMTGARRDLELEDMFELNEESGSEYLGNLWTHFWEPKRLNYNRMKKQKSLSSKNPIPLPSIAWTFYQMFQWDFLLSVLLKFLMDTIQFASPFLLQEMLNYVSNPIASFWKGIAIAVLMFSVSQLRSFLLCGYIYIIFGMSVKIQTTLTTVIYNKILVLSNEERRGRTVGEIVNLMAIDVDKIRVFSPQIPQFWSCPYLIIFSLLYLYLTIGASAFPGVVVMMIFLPINIISAIIVKKWQVKQMKLKDERTKIVNEVLNGIKVVKMYAWEIPMEDHIRNIREQELHLIKKISIVKNLLDSFNVASPFLVALFSFGTYVLSSSENLLTPQIAFVSLTLFNQLRFPMTMLAELIDQTVQAMVSNKRLKEFLAADELNESIVERNEIIDVNQAAIKIESMTTSWDREDHVNATLQDIEMEVPHGSLTMIVGKVGSGKSSLLQAILGEMNKLSGRIIVNGKVAYIPQQPWIQNMSLRDNILFGKPFNRKRYNDVINACALRKDIQLLPARDLTEIGEKGVNLSGGQKSRVSLARAIYQNMDVYLLDDPLSAVDAHVGKHIFEKVIGPNGLLKDKTRVLVTHGLKFANLADGILAMKDGRVVENGTYDELIEQRGIFSNFVNDYESSWDKEQNEIETDELDTVASSEEDDIEDTLSTMSSLIETMMSSEPLRKRSSGMKSTSESTKKLIEKEKVNKGNVDFSIYLLYAKAATYRLSSLFILLFIFHMIMQTLQNFWLSSWSNDYNPVNPSPDPMNVGWRLGVYGILGVSEVVFFFVAVGVLVYVGVSASRNLHNPLVHNLLRSPMSFYDTTPLGRILNRCAADIAIIDILPMNIRDIVTYLLQFVFTIIVIMIATPLFIIAIIPLAILYSATVKFYLPTSRQIRRLESVHRSPIFSLYGETIQGAFSIRAFNKAPEFRARAIRTFDTYVRCRFSSFLANRWRSLRMEFLGSSIVFFAAFFSVLSKEFGWITTAGNVGVSISYSLSMTECLNMAVAILSILGANIVAVERVDEYSNTNTEAEWRVEGAAPPVNWPSRGELKFEKYSTRYQAKLGLVLNEVSVDVKAGEKVGIVGRTGAGKSSFALALFRVIEPTSGRILIDGIDVSQIGLHDLRSNITIIPQDPVLFSGTLRFNLDPFSVYSDENIWNALELAHMKEFVIDLNDGLMHKISEGGENLSVGQRQLVALARALLRHTKLLILDEATAAIDVATDLLIQETIRSQFRDCTVCTIAHRLNTIMDYDRILVLDNGKVVEFDTPANLMANKDSAFSKLVNDVEK